MPKLSTIEPVNIRGIWSDEAKDFTPWLATNISLLGEALGMNLEIVSREAAVGNYRLDLLARDAGGDSYVAIENQLGDTDHGHLGQLITYAAGYDAKTAIWIAGRFRDEHREALDMLNRRTDQNTEFYGVAMQLWKIGDSDPAPHFEVISAPNYWRKSIRTEEVDPAQDGKGELYRDFFQGIVDSLYGKSDALIPRKVTGRSWLSFKRECREYDHGLSFTRAYGGRFRVETYIDCGDRESNKELFDYFEENKGEIEADIGESLHWDRLHTRRACRISAFRPGAIEDDQTELNEVTVWMVETLPKVRAAFKQRLDEWSLRQDEP